MGRVFDVGSSLLASTVRLGAGMVARSPGPRPERLLELYEFEACPFCRIVREALTALDLDAMIYPCPRGGTRFRPIVVERGGKEQFPFLVDPNAHVELYESRAIVRHLATAYGDPGAADALGRGLFTMPSSALASALRLGRGRAVRPARAPEQPLELWSFEGSPFCRIAREKLCSLEIPYVLHNVGKRSPKRDAFVARSGRMRVPYLVDPNTGRAMFESADIVRYLEDTYGATRS
jgi:glutathione S-transferase